MSFGRQVKQELYRLSPERDCCAGTQLWAMISCRLEKSGPGPIHIKAGSLPEARLILKLIRRLGVTAVKWAVSDEKRLVRHQVVMMEFEPEGELKKLLSSGILENCKWTGGLISRNCCKRSFLRGLYLASGSISTGKGGYHLEFTFKDEDPGTRLAEVLESLELKSRVSGRRSHYLVYMKKGEDISSFLTQIGAFNAMLKFEEERAVKETRGHVNRLVNSESANLEKQAMASGRQVHAIKLIKSAGLWKKLPYPLREIGEMREVNPEFSLGELGEQFNPAIKKATVGRRLKRLEDMAENILLRRKS
ncbi:MAG: DNA-binding protein WhiA [Chloroflexi bacterium]|nr:DNA-binding protein WhiA [Chloroflexota bacterium]